MDCFSELIESPHACLPIGRARTGIYLLVKEFVKGRRKKVLMSPYTVPDLVNMVVFAGGVPVFLDQEPKSTQVSVNKLKHLLSDEVACVLITHYHVNQMAVPEIRKLCEQSGAELIEDCAISLGGKIEDGSVGLASRAGVFSFSSFKFLNAFWGGAIISGDDNLIGNLRKEVETWKRFQTLSYRSQFMRTLKYDLATRPGIFGLVTSRILRKKIDMSDGTPLLQMPRIESEVFDPSLQSRPGYAAFVEWNRKMPRVSQYLEHRRGIAAIYDRILGERMIASNTKKEVKENSCYVNYPVWVGAENRDVVYGEMVRSGFDVGLSLYPNVHQHPDFRQFEGSSREVSRLCESIISLPTHPRIKSEYAESLVNRLQSIL